MKSSNLEELAIFEENTRKSGINPEDCHLFEADIVDKMAVAMEGELGSNNSTDLDDSMFENEGKESSKITDCANCTTDSNKDLEVFTSTLNDTEQDGTLVLVGIIIGSVLAVALVTSAIILIVVFACKKFGNKNQRNKIRNGRSYETPKF